MDTMQNAIITICKSLEINPNIDMELLLKDICEDYKLSNLQKDFLFKSYNR